MARRDQDGGAMLTVEQAGALAADRMHPVAEAVELPLGEADGRVLSGTVRAGLDLPRFANSAVDGYALHHADLDPLGATSLPVVGRLAAGQAATGPLREGALRIFTGAPLPPGADTVAMQEDVVTQGGTVTISPGLRFGSHVRPAGEDVARGDTVLEAGHRLRPQDLGLLAALGLERVAVRRRPRVALFSTGDELVEPGRSAGPAAIYDANRAMLRALLQRAGAEPVDLGILADDRDSLTGRLRDAAAGCDLVLTSGGVSVGEEDHVKAAVSAIGRLDFWRIAIKPGKPVAVGSIAETPFVGLPGNPVAVFVTFAFVARPMIARLAGTDWAAPLRVPVRLGFACRRRPGRREFLRVRLEQAQDGLLVAHRHPGTGAGSLASLAQSDGLVELAETLEDAPEGSIQPCLPYAALLG